MRVVLFGSFYRGFFTLQELLHGPWSSALEVVGVATDNPSQRFVSPGKRVWQYPHAPEEESMVADLARKHAIDVYDGRVKSDEFYDLFENHWQPDICFTATFGQKINERLFSYPLKGFFNLHPCDDHGWPSKYVGGNPFQMLLDDGADYCVVALHRVNEAFDEGELMMFSDRIAIPPAVSVVDLHKITSPMAGLLVRKYLDGMGLVKPEA